jgi:hypothetical protein
MKRELNIKQESLPLKCVSFREMGFVACGRVEAHSEAGSLCQFERTVGNPSSHERAWLFERVENYSIKIPKMKGNIRAHRGGLR